MNRIVRHGLPRLWLGLLAGLFLAPAGGCEESCYSDGPGVRVNVTLGANVVGSKLATLKVLVTMRGVTRQEEIKLTGQLDDGSTSVELALGDVVDGAFSAAVEVVVLDAQDQVIAASAQHVSGDEGQCVVIHLTLGLQGKQDYGIPLNDGGPDAPGSDANPKLDKPKPKLDKPKPPPDLPLPPPDLPLPPQDLPLPPPDLPLPPPDMPQPNPDMPQPKPDMPQPNPDAAPIPDVISGSS